MTEQQVSALSDERSALKDSLLRMRAENESLLAQARETLESLAQDEVLTSGSLREVAANAEYQIADASDVIAKIDAALTRFDTDEYGRCTVCGTAIPIERLELRPFATTCVPCSS